MLINAGTGKGSSRLDSTEMFIERLNVFLIWSKSRLYMLKENVNVTEKAVDGWM